MPLVLPAIERYPNCQYVVKNPATWNSASFTAADLDGCSSVSVGDRILCPSGTNAGIWVAGSSTAASRDPSFVTIEGYTVRCVRSAGAPTYRQTATSGAPAFSAVTDTGSRFVYQNACLTLTALQEIRILCSGRIEVQWVSDLYATYPTEAQLGVCVDGVWALYPGNQGSLVLNLDVLVHEVIIREGPRGLLNRGTVVTAITGDYKWYTPAAPSVRMVVIGDSISCGMRAAAVTDAWPAKLRDTSACATTCWGVGSAGVRDFKHVAAVLTGCFDGTDSNYLWIAVGYNDFGAQLSPSSYQTYLAALVDELHAAYPSVVIYVQSPIPATNESGTTYNLSDYRTACANVVATRTAFARYVDGATEMVITTADLSDGIHPTAAGYAKMARGVVDVIWGEAFRTALELSTHHSWQHPDYGRTVAGGKLTAWADHTGEGFAISSSGHDPTDGTLSNMPAAVADGTHYQTVTYSNGTATSHWFGFILSQANSNAYQYLLPAASGIIPEIHFGGLKVAIAGVSHNNLNATLTSGTHIVEYIMSGNSWKARIDGVESTPITVSGQQFHPTGIIGDGSNNFVGSMATVAYCDDADANGVGALFRAWATRRMAI